MAQRDEDVDLLLSLVRPERRADGSWVNRAPELWGEVVFGGMGLAMTIGAACGDAPDGNRLHSLHAHFLRPVRGGEEITFRTEVVKAGRTFALHQVTASQGDRPCLTAACSFTADVEGEGVDVYDVAGLPDDVPQPDDLPPPPPSPDGEDDDAGPWEVRWLGPSPLRPDGTRESTHRHWFRVARPLDDDVHLHIALLGYATDWTGTGGRPLHLDGDTTGMISLDHAAWFHRPARADEWLLQDVQALVNAGGRGTLRGVLRDTAGRIVASVAQEMLLRPVAGAPVAR